MEYMQEGQQTLELALLLFIKVVSHCPEVDPRWTHKYVPSAAPSGIFWHAEDFAKTPEADADAGETQLMVI